MASDLISNLLLDKSIPTSKIINVKELNGSDSFFIISNIIGYCVKNKIQIILISTHYSFHHYQNVGIKLSYNFQTSVESGLINYFDIAEICTKSLINNELYSIESLLTNVRELFLNLKANGNCVSIIFDGVSHLSDLQYSLQEINRFCRQLIRLVRAQCGSFAIFHNNIASEDDATDVLSNLLSHQACTVVEVGNLSSGLSADVSGHLVIKHLGTKYDNDMIMDVRFNKFLFKLFDRGVKMFAPGVV